VIACRDNFLLDIARDNIPAPSLAVCGEETGSCGLAEMGAAVDLLLSNAEQAQWDIIALFTNQDICGRIAGCNGYQGLIWIEVKKDESAFPYQFAIKDSVLSHEIGKSPVMIISSVLQPHSFQFSQ
jgi:hypothetical protein